MCFVSIIVIAANYVIQKTSKMFGLCASLVASVCINSDSEVTPALLHIPKFSIKDFAASLIYHLGQQLNQLRHCFPKKKLKSIAWEATDN